MTRCTKERILLRAEQSRAEQSRAEQSRADWIDVLKGIGIILVVIGHVNTKGFLVQWLYTFEER